MKEIIEQYGLMILGCIGAAAVTAVFTALLYGPLSAAVLAWTERFL